jgi:hypothetical protein
MKLSLSMGVFYNNYTGWGNEFGISPTYSLVNSANGKLSAGLALKSSSESGMTITPSLSLSTNNDKKDEINRNIGLSIGAPINSREGLKQISFGASVSASTNAGYRYGKEVEHMENMEPLKIHRLQVHYQVAFHLHLHHIILR